MKPNKTVLVVEDSKIQATLLQNLLEDKHFSVLQAKDGVDAIEKLKKNTIDLIISDIEMPNMNGFELCKHVKAKKKWQNIPIILITSLLEPKNIMASLDCKADHYITKPYEANLLMTRIEYLLSRQAVKHREESVNVEFAGEKYTISANPQQILNMLMSTYENAVYENRQLIRAQLKLKQLHQQIQESFDQSEKLLLNILPKAVADDLKSKGSYPPLRYDSVSVLFTDIKGFTELTEKLEPPELVSRLEECFNYFDQIIEKHKIEKLKTIGDSYMCAAGLPIPNHRHAIDCVLVGLGMQKFIRDKGKEKQEKGEKYWQLRVGIHTGPVMAGVIGNKKFAYDIWGDTVNTASRMESSCFPGLVNVSEDTYLQIADFFECEYRGEVPAKNKGNVKMYFVHRIKPEYSKDRDGYIPNNKLYTDC